MTQLWHSSHYFNTQHAALLALEFNHKSHTTPSRLIIYSRQHISNTIPHLILTQFITHHHITSHKS